MSNGKFCDNPKCSMHVSDEGREDNRLRVIDKDTWEVSEVRRVTYLSLSLDAPVHFCEVCNEAITMTLKR